MVASITHRTPFLACSSKSASNNKLHALVRPGHFVAAPHFPHFPRAQGLPKPAHQAPAMITNDRFRASAAAQVSGTGTASNEADPSILEIWRSADAVAFDVDSTLCEDESIDEVAAYLGCGKEVADMTNKAMGGNVSFREALQMRLDIMQVSQEHMADFLASHPPRISPGIKELVSTLHARGKTVYLVSGGFRQIIEPVAEILNIPKSNIFANQILYKWVHGQHSPATASGLKSCIVCKLSVPCACSFGDSKGTSMPVSETEHCHQEDGKYAGFDTEEFTSKSGGKPAALRHIKETFGHKSVVMIGDGATDLEARSEGVADIFIGYGGVVVRENIAKEADWYITSFDGLIEALNV